MPALKQRAKPKRRISIPSLWTDRVRLAWKLPDQLTVSQFADRDRVLDDSSAEPGQWRTDRTPYLRGIMDAFNDPFVEKIVIQASTQVGKTECLMNMLAYGIAQDPGPAMWVDSTEPEATDICVERIIPMAINTPALSRHLPYNPDLITKRGIRFDRMRLKIAWATSPSSLASRAIRYLFLNEINKYPPFSGREADPVKLAQERTRTFHNRKIVECSTPTTTDGYITRDYERTDMRKYYVPCPHCNHYQILVWKQVKFPSDERDPQKVKLKKLAHYECIKCKGVITDIMKPKMLLKGRWVPDGWDPNQTEGIKFPAFAEVGFWINSLYSPWLTFSDIAAEWLSSYYDPALLMNFINSWLAEPFREETAKKKEDDIAKLAGNYDAGTVPEEALVLTGFVDVQKDFSSYVIRAWGMHGRSWLIKAARIEGRSFQPIEEDMINTTYGSRNMPVLLCLIDSGYRTDEVYEFCSNYRDRCRPSKGKDYIVGDRYRITNQDRYPNGKPIPGGMGLYTLDTTYFKDKTDRLIKNSSEDGPSRWLIHRNPSPEYLRQICSEHKVIIRDRRTRKARESWQKITSHTPNHYWDCEVGATAAAEILRVFYWRPEEVQQSQARTPRPDSEEHTRTGWIQKQTNWIRNNG